MITNDYKEDNAHNTYKKTTINKQNAKEKSFIKMYHLLDLSLLYIYKGTRTEN